MMLAAAEWDRPDSNLSRFTPLPASNPLCLLLLAMMLAAAEWDRPDSNRGHGHPRPGVYH